MHNIKVIYNFVTFLESINTPSFDQRFSSYDHCKLGGGVLLEFSSGQIEITGKIWDLSSLPMENWQNLEYKDHTEFHKLSNKG
jgi:hypothetical protein